MLYKLYGISLKKLKVSALCIAFKAELSNLKFVEIHNKKNQEDIE